MGKLVWHEYARYVAMTASVYTVWACFWGLFYRKFFWDFVGGILRAPGGLQPAPSAQVFIMLIVKLPVIQIMTMIMALFMIMLEYPAPFMKGTAIQRSIVVRIPALLFQTFLAILFYQGTNGAIWSLVATFAYTRAYLLGETMAEAKDNRGKGSAA